MSVKGPRYGTVLLCIDRYLCDAVLTGTTYRTASYEADDASTYMMKPVIASSWAWVGLLSSADLVSHHSAYHRLEAWRRIDNQCPGEFRKFLAGVDFLFALALLVIQRTVPSNKTTGFTISRHFAFQCPAECSPPSLSEAGI